MRTFVIDGYNLLYKVPEFSERETENLEEWRERLINRLVSLSAGKKIQLHIVFDTSRVRGGRKSYSGIRVDYASPSADLFIRHLIAENQSNKSLVVVSSDSKDIGDYAKICGVEWMRSEEFWSWMTKSSRKGGKEDCWKREVSGAAPPGWTDEEDALLRRIFEAENGNDEADDH